MQLCFRMFICLSLFCIYLFVNTAEMFFYNCPEFMRLIPELVIGEAMEFSVVFINLCY